MKFKWVQKITVALLVSWALPAFGLEETPPPVSGHNEAIPAEITPADVMSRLDLFHQELDFIRFEMGAPLAQKKNISVSNAKPRELNSQLQTMLKKANRLCFELTRMSYYEPSQETGPVLPYHNWHLVNNSLKLLRRIKAKLNINKTGIEKAFDGNTTSSHGFQSAFQANSQLNEMLELQFSASEAYQQVSTAIHYAARLLEPFRGATRLPKPPALQHGKTPKDNYSLLLGIFQTIATITSLSGEKILSLDPTELVLSNTTSSEVYDLSTLIAAELAFLHNKLPNARAPLQAFYPGRRFSSHVFQQAQVLEMQIATLAEKVKQNPNWLKI